MFLRVESIIHDLGRKAWMREKHKSGDADTLRVHRRAFPAPAPYRRYDVSLRERAQRYREHREDQRREELF